MNGVHDLRLPDFENTEQAVRFGQFISRDQYVLISGARDALQREWDRLHFIYRERSERGVKDRTLMQILADLATTIGKMREALESAPDLVLASLIGGDRVVTRNGDRVQPIRFEKIEVGQL